EGSTPNPVSLASRSRQEKPASISTRVPAASRNTALPALPLPRMAPRKGALRSASARVPEPAGASVGRRQLPYLVQLHLHRARYDHLPDPISPADGVGSLSVVDHDETDLT